MSGIAHSNDCQVLVVDDDPLFCDHVCRLLEPDGYQVLVARDAYDALAASRSIRPDAVLIDVVLPDIEGPQLCRLLRQTPGFEAIPVVFITARESSQVLKDCLLAGGNDFLRKSHVEVELPLRLANHLRLKHEHDLLRRRNQELDSLLYFARLLNRSLNVDNVLQSMVEELSQTLGADRVSVILWHQNSGKVVATAEAAGMGLELDLSKYPEIAQALTTRQTVYIEDVRTSDDLNLGCLEILDDLGLQSVLVVPLQTGGALLGTLFLRTLRPLSIPPEAVAFCQAAAEIACRALVNARLFEHVRAERDALLEHGHALFATPDVMRLQSNLTAEAMGIVTLISGYAELLLDPRDNGQLEVRQARALSLLQEQASNLEQIIRMMQLLQGRHGNREGAASEVVRSAMQEVQPLLHNSNVSLQVATATDFPIRGRERWCAFLLCLLRDLVRHDHAGGDWLLHIDQPQILLQRRCGGNEQYFWSSWHLWQDVADVFGGRLKAINAAQPTVAICFDSRNGDN